jgi:hypothetical protein
MHKPRRLVVLGTASLLVPLAGGLARNQEPAPVPPPPEAQSQSPGAIPAHPGKATNNAKQKYSHANDFLIHGTVFSDKALSFPGVQLRIRRTAEKKFRWESYTNSRGEFAVRVPQGSDYEMVIHAKGFIDQTRAIDAKNGLSEDNVVFRIEPAAGGKK